MSTIETPSSIEISQLIENVERHAERFMEKSEVVEGDEIKSCLENVSKAVWKVFDNLIPVWRKENIQILPNICVNHMPIKKKTTTKAKVLQWFVWEVELMEIAMAYDSEELSEIKKSILQLAEAYAATGRAFESSLKIKSFGPFEVGVTASPATTKDTLDGVIMSMATI